MRRLKAAPALLAVAVPAAVGVGLLGLVVLGLTGWRPLEPDLGDFAWIGVTVAGAVALWVAGRAFDRFRDRLSPPARPWSLSVIAGARQAFRPLIPAASVIVAVALLDHTSAPSTTLHAVVLAVVAASLAAALRDRPGGDLLAMGVVAGAGWLLSRWDRLWIEDLADRLLVIALWLWIVAALYLGIRLTRRGGPLRSLRSHLASIVVVVGVVVCLHTYARSGLGAAAFAGACALLLSIVVDRRRLRRAVYPALLAVLIAVSALAAPERPLNRLGIALDVPIEATSAPIELSVSLYPHDPGPLGCGSVEVFVRLQQTEESRKHPAQWDRAWPALVDARWRLRVESTNGSPRVALSNLTTDVETHRARDEYRDEALEITGKGLAQPTGDHNPSLDVSLLAQWATPSSIGACYVLLPAQSNDTSVLRDSAPDDLFALTSDMEESVSPPAHANLVAEQSVPAPVAAEPGEPPSTWRCGPSHPEAKCQAIALIRTSWSDSYLQAALLLAGALISLAAEAWLRDPD